MTDVPPTQVPPTDVPPPTDAVPREPADASGPTGAAPSAGGATEPAGVEGEQVMDLLAEHVPLALLVDLITPEGPPSGDILRTEGMPDDPWWEAPDGTASSTEPPRPREGRPTDAAS